LINAGNRLCFWRIHLEVSGRTPPLAWCFGRTSALARVGENVPACVGALFINGGCVWLGFGATLPSYRGKGIQGTLAIETGHAGMDESPNQSHRNVLRAGFLHAYFRHQYVGTGDAPSFSTPPHSAN
jgi:hypothetical protein